MGNFEKNAKKITNAVIEFVAKEFGPLSEEDKIKKIGEYLEGFQRRKKINGTNLVILQLPEGVKGAINPQGKLFDLYLKNEI